jgi:hypothetical protein
LPPRKVIVGSVVQPFWVQYPGLDQRVAELAAIVGETEAAAQARYGRGLDLAVLPEDALTGETGEETLARAVAWDGSVSAAFARLARRARCYLVVPTYLRERDAPPRCSNAAVLVDRSGNVAGVYRKVHLVVSDDGKRLEGGATPGSTWRDNASLFEPTGKIAAQVRPPARILVEEIDLSYAILPWSAKLRKGKALEEKYGARIGYRYYEDEDCGLFWSNDAETPVRRMIEALGLREADEELARARACYRAARVPGY